MDAGESGGSAAWRVRYSTYSTYSMDAGESGGSAAWRVRYSTYSTYSKDAGESGGSAAWLQCRAGAARRLLCQASGAQFCCNIAATRVSHGAILNQIMGGSSMQGFPAFPVPLSVEGVFQMAYIVPERLLTLVRPAFDLVLRRIRSLKRCVEA